jgi:hypothetical protein
MGKDNSDHNLRANERHSQTSKHRGKNQSEKQRKANKQEALTSYQRRRDREVKRGKEIQQARGAHSLLCTEGGSGQVRSAKGGLCASGTHFLSSTRKGLIRTAKESQPAILTSCQAQRDQLIRIAKESQSARATHFLSNTWGATH